MSARGEQGFVSGDLLIGAAVFTVLLWIGLGIAALLRLTGWLYCLSAFALPLAWVMFFVVGNIMDGVRARRRRREVREQLERAVRSRHDLA